MIYKLVPTKTFLRELKKLSKKYPSIFSDLDKIRDLLVKIPSLGNPVYKNCYKVRVPISSMNKGKSGSARLITYVVAADSNIFLLTIYAKSERDSISDKQIKQMLKELDDAPNLWSRILKNSFQNLFLQKLVWKPNPPYPLQEH